MKKTHEVNIKSFSFSKMKLSLDFTIGFSRLGVAQRIGKCLWAPQLTEISKPGAFDKSAN
jgi:hypothetical protein